MQTGIRRDADQRSFELAHVVDDVVGDERQHRIGNAVEVLGFGLLTQNREPSLELRRLNVGDEPPLEPAAETVFDRGDRLRRPVGGDHDLRAAPVQVVEGVEEFFLELLGALEELDVINEQHVDLAVPAFEGGHSLRTHGINELVHHGFRGNVTDAFTRKEGANMVPNCVKKVRLAETGGTVDEQRVVRTRGTLGDRQRGRVREAVRRADDELVERVARIQLRRGPRRSGVVLGRPRTLFDDRGRSRERRVGGLELDVGARRRAHDELDRVWHASQRLDGVGEEAEVARTDALDRDRARHAEQQRVIGAVEGVHSLEPRVPRRFRKLRPHCCRDFGPQVICRWSTQGRLPDLQARRPQECPHMWRSRSDQARSALLGLGEPRGCGTRRGSSRPFGAVRAAGGAELSALWTSQQASRSGADPGRGVDCCWGS